jgi:V8-like Glu-specific endopeptidase
MACGPADLDLLLDEELSERSEAIINGTVDTGHVAVGRIMHSKSWCSATLVGKRTVLTASHCVSPNKSAPYTVYGGIYFQLNSSPNKYYAQSVVMHPQYDFADPQSPDIAVLRLSNPVTEVPPIVIAKGAPKMGEPIVVVGYGQTSTSNPQTAGIKRKGHTVVGAIKPTSFTYYGKAGASVCYGDSGGPTFGKRNGAEMQLGVHAVLLPSGQCEEGAIDTRLDVYYGWILKHAQGDLATSADTAPPKAQITSPPPHSTPGPSFQVNVVATDNVGVSRVELFIDGALLHQKNTLPYHFQVANLPAGNHNIRADALDKAGRRASTMIQVTVHAPPFNGPKPADSPGNQPYTDQGTFACAFVPLHAPRAAPLGWLVLLLLFTAACLVRSRSE